LLSKIVSINNIYNSIQTNENNGNIGAVYYDFGRLTRIMIDFDPIETYNLQE
jgi:hypothetical protein